MPNRAATRYSRILGVGAYRPPRIVRNADLAAVTGRTDEWIRRRTGIVERRYAAPDETVLEMAVQASTKALAAAAVPPAGVDVVLLASMSDLHQSPPSAPRLAHRIGSTAAALDLDAACSGFCHALSLAGSLVRSNQADHVLVVGSERMTDIVAPDDPSCGFLFADGAGAVVVGPSDEPGIGPTVWGSDGGRASLIAHDASWLEYRDDPERRWPAMRMEGQDVYRWAIETMPTVARRALAEAGVEAADLDAFVPHQANLRMIDTMVERMELPGQVTVARDVIHSGNTSAASIPLAVSQLLEIGVLRSGSLALLAGYGAGLSYAAQVVLLP
ncbi:beta-ketoacyl-ACP synthase 3 [Streptomyces caeruleatus]|uniref:3-oxoacyl-ACP synthase n=1 Tax=Streptomyces caeruleatus TaxID=661399 RepID=A0A101U8Y1_9ACTN|nr:beta-ketoacyl-ACP synthase 3 [Streptomyces caeruleatus]KUO06136.1 3-oxoacyl-ACP synthase [Streptomyces caeruleatus]